MQASVVSLDNVLVSGDRVRLQDAIFPLGGSSRRNDVEFDIAHLDHERPTLATPLAIVVLVEEQLEESERSVRGVLGLVQLGDNDDVDVRAFVTFWRTALYRR
jgi:hypothetical protein